MRVRLLVLFIFLSGCPVWAQQIQWNLEAKVGIPITSGIAPVNPPRPGVTTTTISGNPRILGGPGLFLLVDDSLSVDGDVLFRPIRDTTRREQACCSGLAAVRGSS